MPTKSRGIAIVLAALTVIAPHLARSAEVDSAITAQPTADVELTAFVRAIVEANPQVNAARAALDASVALQGAAGRPLYNPSLEIEAENAASDSRSVGISQTFDWGGKGRARTAVAKSQRNTVEAEYVAARWQVTSDLLNAIASHQTESARYALATTRAGTMRDFADLAQRRFDTGDISQVDFDLAVLAFTQARIQQATAAASVAEEKQAMRTLDVSSRHSAWPMLGTDFPTPTISPSEVQDLVMSLPEVRAARFRVTAAAALVELRQRERRQDPTFTLRGGKEDDESLIGLNITVPLAVRNRFKHEVTAASAQRRQAQQIASYVSRRSYARFIGAEERYRLSQNAWRDWENTGGVSLERQGDLLRRLWESGEIGTTDYLVQIRQTLDTRESALELRQALWRAWFEWLAASGQIEDWLGIKHQL
jgi:cobalt-zinc-cadmium efflux system outer membrane protein